MKVYLCGPIRGIAFGESQDWRAHAEQRLTELGHTVFTPMAGKDYLSKETIIKGTYEEHPLSTAVGIVNRDRFYVKQCDAILANFTGATKASVGSVCEVAWAHIWHKFIVLVIDKPYPENPHNHPFLTQVGVVVPTLDDAIDAIHVSRGRTLQKIHKWIWRNPF